MKRGLRLWATSIFNATCFLRLSRRGDVALAFHQAITRSKQGFLERRTQDESSASKLQVSLDKGAEPGQPLIPEGNPYADGTAVSTLSGVRFSPVLSGLNELYPPQELSQRNAWSRTDGYWPYIQKGDDPPEHLTYGEFDFYFFAELLDRAHCHFCQQSEGSVAKSGDWTDMVFIDIGSAD